MPPSLTASGVCTGTAIGSATFVITNNGGDMTSPYTYEIEDDNGNVVDTGTFQLGAGASTIINVSGSSNTYTLSSPDDSNVSADADTTRCAPPPPPPSLSAVGACSSNAGEAMFIITNNGGDMSAPYTYDIEDDNGNVVDTGTFQLSAGQSANIKVSGSSMTYTLTSPDDGSLNATADLSTCVQPPSLSVSGACTSASGIATFVVTNNGGDMTSAYSYEITDDNGNVVQSSTFQLNAGQSASFTIGGSSSSYTFASPNDSSLTDTADMTTCAPPPSSPALSAVGVCTSNEGEVRFVITNTGADMSTPYTYEITDANGNAVQSASFQLMSGQSVVVIVSGSSTLYTLSSPDDSSLTAQADTSTCVVPPPPPALTATGLCIANSDFASFIITNGGGDMTVAEVYTVTDANGNVVQTGSFQLKAGQSLSFKVDGSGGELVLSIAGAGGLNVRVASTNCYEPVLSVAPAGSSICIQCLVFHTFRDDNLEIYRLDGIEGQEGFELFNLSKSEAVDSRPSRSPNDSWVVFQSNRDGNVELYYTNLSGSGNPIKLTNSPSTVNNINPMYGPDSKTVVFQSDRGGRFDLFTIDQESGEEVQITSDPADDINPFYSPDLKRLVFQSNRNGNWDIFVLDVETGNEFQLTDSLVDETFPAWSPNGKQIAYLVNVDGATDLYVIDLDTRETKRITIDGRTNNHVWSPEGNRIAYQSERNGNLDVYTYDFMTNEEYRVTDYEGPDSGPTWDCGGVNLAFTSIRDSDANIFQVFWKGGSAGNMTIDPATDKWSQWRPSNDVSSTGY
jgi:Tol biopolymer transport system component